MQDVIKQLYPNIKNKDIIKATKYGRYAKADIMLSVRNKKRGISLKCGYKNSVHTEPINKITEFLIKNGESEKNIDMFLRYLYSDGTNNNTGIVRIKNDEYIDKHYSDIIEINKMFERHKNKLIKRFLIDTYVNYHVKADIFIHGTVYDFIWATKDEIEVFLNNEPFTSRSVHCGKLYIQNWDKNIYRNEKYEYCRNYIQVKWFSMYDDIISIMANRENFK